MPCLLEEGETRMLGRKAQMEAVYTHMWASHEGGPFAPLDESLHPRPHSMLYEVATTCGVSASSRVLDVGCGRGNHSCALAQRFGCAVVGLDVAQFHVEQGQARAVQEGVSDRVSFVQGDIETLPFEDERFDFLWSRDMLMHVPALPQALAECARVLQLEGYMLVYTTVATGRMEPKEAAWLYASFSLVPESMDEGAVEAAFQAAGFQMHSKEPLGSELMEWVEEYEGRTSRELMRLARMLRKPEYYQELLGPRRYEVALANYHWALYILLGKLCPTLYVLRKTALS
jgi:ubiquinone/menaquinone biosynthesis C-methylase UbiE